MKKSSVGLIILFTLFFLLISGCLSTNIASTGEQEKIVEETSGNEINETTIKLNQPDLEFSEKTSPYLYWEYELGDVVPEKLSEGRANNQDCVRYSPDEKYVAAGTDSKLIVFDISGKKVLWEKSLTGRVSELTFSQDGRYLLVGEKSPQGKIYFLDAGTGEAIHSYDTANELGTSPDPKYQPSIYSIKATGEGIYVAAGRYWQASGYGLASKVYKFDSDGTLSWKLPTTGNYPQSVNWIDSSLDGKNVVFSTGDWTNSLDTNVVIYSVDEKGSLRWKYEISPFKPYFVSAAIWHGLDVSDDGSMITAYTGDGRTYLFYDSEMTKPGDGSSKWDSNEWQANITVPEEVGGSYIYPYGESAKIASPNETLYLTGNTLPVFYPNKVPLAHTLENSLVSCAAETGETSWIYPLGGRSRGIMFSPNMKFFVLPVGKDISTGNSQAHGIHVFDNQKSGNGNSRLLWKFNAEGVITDATISSNCTVAAIEVPLKLGNGEVIGKHRLIVVR